MTLLAKLQALATAISTIVTQSTAAITSLTALNTFLDTET